MAIGIAVVGLEPVALEEYIPALTDSDHFVLRAVYSHVQAVSQVTADKHAVDSYAESSDDPSRSLEALFGRRDIKAIITALPGVPPDPVIIRALKAGKHVLSDQPMAIDVAKAKTMLKWYKANCDEEILWSVGQHIRYEEPVLFAVRQLKDLGGIVKTFTLKKHIKSAEGDQPSTHGAKTLGFYERVIASEGTSCAAALRLLLSAVGESVTKVSALTSLHQHDHTFKDGVNATIQLSNGNSGTLSVSRGTEIDNAFEVQIATDGGLINIIDCRVTLTKAGSQKGTEQYGERNFPAKSNSIKRMVEVFGEGIKRGKVETRGLPEEALEDLKIIQAIVNSSEEGGAVKNIL